MFGVLLGYVRVLFTSILMTSNSRNDCGLIDCTKKCTISTKYKIGDLNEPQPLLLKQTDNLTIWYPHNDDGMLSMQANDFIYLACPGKNNYLKDRSWSNEAKAVCVKDNVFHVNKDHHEFSSLVCNYHPKHYAKYMSFPESGCLDGHSSIEIGFDVENTFIRTIELCRDEYTYTTYYTKFKLSKMIQSHQQNYPRPSKFLTGGFYPGINLDHLYHFNTQLRTLAEILDSTELAKNRLKKSVQFLSRGHLVANADFIYGALQRSTFWYLNTAPQWQSFNRGNWNSLEINVRRFAARRRLDLDVYTGVHGQMTMEDVHGKQQPVYLHANVSVPKFFWKVIYDPLSKRGAAFVGLNDPFIKSVTDDIYLCTDISTKLEWLYRWNYDITAGISYACNIADLQKAVPTIPMLDVIDILI